jgi:mono/diheme cytochrome c family protein
VQRVIFNFMYLNQDTGAQNVNAEARADNHYVAEGPALPLEGMWKIKVTVRQKGVEDVSVEFPYFIEPRFPDESIAPVMTAQLALQKAQATMNALTSLRMSQQLNDGAGNVALSDYEYQAPDRTKFGIQGQGESIAIGSQQYYQDKDGNWFARTRVEPFVFPNFNFADTALRTREGRADRINNQPAQIYLFDTLNTSGTERIHYAYWLDANARVVQVGMVTASHYMLEQYSDFDNPAIKIEPPAQVQVLPTPAPVAATNSTNNPLSAAVQGNGRPRGFITGDLEGDGALVMVVVGVIIVLVGTGGKRKGNARWVAIGTGAVAIVLGVGLFIDAVNATTAATQSVPVNVSRASSGQQIYTEYCQACHGEKGYGDGPGATALPTQPFDLTTHVLLHDEQYLHAVILNGRGYMPAFGDRLSQDQILDVIAYTRLLARNAQQANPNATPVRRGFTPQP